MYALGDTVTTPKGKGEVVYVEDGYIEVDVNGVEMSFEAPYTGLSAYVPEPPRAAPASDMTEPTPEYDPLWEEVLTNDPLAARLTQAYHMRITAMVRALPGSSAATWEELNSFQKLNFLKVAAGISIDDIKKEIA